VSYLSHFVNNSLQVLWEQFRSICVQLILSNDNTALVHRAKKPERTYTKIPRSPAIVNDCTKVQSSFEQKYRYFGAASSSHTGESDPAHVRLLFSNREGIFQLRSFRVGAIGGWWPTFLLRELNGTHFGNGECE
jgi:hypothetical protein